MIRRLRPRPARPGHAFRGQGAVRRGATLLPSLLTVGNLFAGFFAIMAASDGRPWPAAAAIVVAGMLDLLDGRIARLTGASSEFGTQLDSLADAVSFGVAPAVLAQQWALVPLQRVGWCAAFLFAACGVIRLARFNARHALLDHRFFIGLPIPVAALSVAAAVLLALDLREDWVPDPRAAAAVLVILSALMVSPVRYRSFKGDPRRPYVMTAIFAMLIAAAAARPGPVLAAGAAAYVLSGPAGEVWRRRRARMPAPAEETRGDIA